jgi:hypothetical protein
MNFVCSAGPFRQLDMRPKAIGDECLTDLRGWLGLGRAVAFRRYSDRYVGEEDEARRAGSGLWAGFFDHPGCYRAQLRGTECKDVLPTN